MERDVRIFIVLIFNSMCIILSFFVLVDGLSFIDSVLFFMIGLGVACAFRLFFIICYQIGYEIKCQKED